ALRDLGAAVSTNVEKCPQLSITSARQQDRYPGIVVGRKAPGHRPLRGETHEQWPLAEQQLPFAVGVRSIAVDRHVVAPGGVGQGRGFAIQMLQETFQKLNLLLPVHAQLPCRTACWRPFRDCPRLDTMSYHFHRRRAIRYRITNERVSE